MSGTFDFDHMNEKRREEKREAKEKPICSYRTKEK
jgi:hypothetical protein